MNPAILAIFIFESTFYNSLGKTAVYMDCYILSRYFLVFFPRLRFVRQHVVVLEPKQMAHGTGGRFFIRPK